MLRDGMNLQQVLISGDVYTFRLNAFWKSDLKTPGDYCQWTLDWLASCQNNVVLRATQMQVTQLDPMPLGSSIDGKKGLFNSHLTVIQ